jgi:hypothetical protein
MSDFADALAHSGQSEEAIGLLHKAMRLNPFYPDEYLWHLGGAYYNLKRYEDAIQAVSGMQNPTEGHRILAASYAQLGRMERGPRACRESARGPPRFRPRPLGQNHARQVERGTCTSSRPAQGRPLILSRTGRRRGRPPCRDTLAPETLAPDTLAPDTLAADTPAPDTTPAPRRRRSRRRAAPARTCRSRHPCGWCSRPCRRTTRGYRRRTRNRQPRRRSETVERRPGNLGGLASPGGCSCTAAPSPWTRNKRRDGAGQNTPLIAEAVNSREPGISFLISCLTASVRFPVLAPNGSWPLSAAGTIARTTGYGRRDQGPSLHDLSCNNEIGYVRTAECSKC